MKNERGESKAALKDVLYIPKLRLNLISVSRITDNGYIVEFDKCGAKIMSNTGEISTIAKRKMVLYVVNELENKNQIM